MNKQRADVLMDEFKSIILHLEGGGRPLTADEVDGMLDKMERMLAIVNTGHTETEHLKERLGDMELQRSKLFRVKRHKLFYDKEDRRIKVDSVEMSQSRKVGQYHVKGFHDGRHVGSYLIQIDRVKVEVVGGVYLIEYYIHDGVTAMSDPWLTIEVNPTERKVLETFDPWFKRETHYPVFEKGKHIVGNAHNRKCAYCLHKLTSVRSCDKCKSLKRG